MSAKTSFRGSFTALVTPFKNGSVDEKAFRDLVDWQIAEGTNGLVPVGTTGESPTLSHDEHKRRRGVVRRPGARPRPGRGRRRLQLDQGGDRTRRSTPRRPAPTRCWWSRPITTSRPRKGSTQHFKAINDAIGIPIIIYNIPGRSVIDMSVDTMKRLFELKNIAGVKDATANMARVSQQRAAMGEDFNQLSGEDITALGFMAHGGHGCISVTSNVAPRLCAEFQAACLRGDFAAALKLQDKLAPLHINLFIETNPRRSNMRCRCSANATRLAVADGAGKRKGASRRAPSHGPCRLIN